MTSTSSAVPSFAFTPAAVNSFASTPSSEAVVIASDSASLPLFSFPSVTDLQSATPVPQTLVAANLQSQPAYDSLQSVLAVIPQSFSSSISLVDKPVNEEPSLDDLFEDIADEVEVQPASAEQQPKKIDVSVFESASSTVLALATAEIEDEKSAEGDSETAVKEVSGNFEDLRSTSIAFKPQPTGLLSADCNNEEQDDFSSAPGSKLSVSTDSIDTTHPGMNVFTYIRLVYPVRLYALIFLCRFYQIAPPY
jgi:hypothetical protein